VNSWFDVIEREAYAVQAVLFLAIETSERIAVVDGEARG
jgi:hypothetical protein